MMRRSLMVAAVVLLAACGQGPEVRLDEVGNPMNPDELQPAGELEELPRCTDGPPEATSDPAPPGLFVPEEAVVTKVENLGQLTTVEGWIDQTPSQMRRGYPAREDLEMLMVEDEFYDAEVLVTDQVHRMYLGVVALCRDQSRWAATVTTEEVAEGEVPVPLPSVGTTPDS